MKKSYNYILFDWDGCLAKTLDLILETYRTLFSEYGLSKTDKELISIWGDWKGPLKLGLPEKDLNAWIKKYVETVNTNAANVTLYPDVENMLMQLAKAGKKLALLSSSSKTTVEPSLTRHRLHKYFSVFLYAEDVEKHKPDPEIIEKALSLLQGSKEQAIIIGDSKSDLGAAKNAGIDSLLYFPKHNEIFYSLEDLRKFNPTYVIHDFLIVPKLIN